MDAFFIWDKDRNLLNYFISALKGRAIQIALF